MAGCCSGRTGDGDGDARQLAAVATRCSPSWLLHASPVASDMILLVKIALKGATAADESHKYLFHKLMNEIVSLKAPKRDRRRDGAEI